jgi:hypothetical protein
VPAVSSLSAASPSSALAPSSTSSTSSTMAARVWPDEPIEVDGTEVRSAGQRWSVGEPGDLVAVGDWDCDGAATPAVLRPSLARVFMFRAWAGESDVTAVPGPVVPPDAVAFAADGCGRARVTTSSGATVVVEMEVDGR